MPETPRLCACYYITLYPQRRGGAAENYFLFGAEAGGFMPSTEHVRPRPVFLRRAAGLASSCFITEPRNAGSTWSKTAGITPLPCHVDCRGIAITITRTVN